MTAERSARLYRLIALLSRGARSRDYLLRKLRIVPRGFYRDLQKLRQFRVRLTLVAHQYRLAEPFERAISRLPFPDPQLNWHEALQLARGSGPAQKKLRQQIRRMTG
jgi:hypothetical protein